ncbi:aspartate aminotransferase family protein [Acuticoccus sp. I52.16.1]|uniref:aspartate aminotransferase family protein n=1 Tax=Acuticoccus sp. I52.16.1 TaxID=2928472 RepID=UPI00352D97BD
MAGPANTATANIQAVDARHHWHPFSDMAALNAAGSRVIVGAEGVSLTDSEGHQILDGMSGLWNVAVGYGRREIVDAVAEALTTLSYTNTFFQCTHPLAATYAQAIAELLPAHLNRVFFTSSGSEANDTAFRAARTYWDLKGRPGKKRFIARRNGYHGSTVLGASLGGMAPMHAQSGLPIEGISHIDQPYWFGDGRHLGMTPDEYGIFAADRLAAEIDRLGADTVAAFIGEPIQGAGGVVIPPDTYWPRIAEICRSRDILLIADEVICGFGRTGAMWGFETFGFSPDIVTMAKAMTSGYVPCGGVAFSDDVAATLEEGGEFFHGYTASGHPAACAAGLANLAIFARERLVERVADDIGPYLAKRWASLGDHPIVGEARMRGLIGALELVRDKAALARFPGAAGAGTRCRDLAVANGLVMRAVGDTMVIAPPLVISHAAADRLVARARATLDALAAELLPA